MSLTADKKHGTKKFLKIISYIVLSFFAIFLIFSIGLSIYFNNHKSEIVADINQKINENIKGNVSIGDVGYTLIKGFPNFALTIDNVVVKDSLWAQHKKTLLTAKEIEVHINIKKLIFNKEVDIKKIQINNATIYIYVDKNGVSNSDIFKPKPKDSVAKPKKKVRIDEIALDNVEFISENIKLDKLFDFDVTELDGDVEYNNDDWKIDLYLNTLAKSMAFKLSKGSFIKNKRVKGTLDLNFSAKENKITVVTKQLGIGDDKFDITAHFSLDKKNPLFDLDITTEILWLNAAHLLDAHIYKILNHFNITKPLKANCTIAGNMSVKGDPVIVVKAEIKDNELVTTDGVFTNCSFNGEYNNTYKKGMGTSDENSAVILTNFSAVYKTIPFSIPKGMIYNITVPTATGTFKSKFEVKKINQFFNPNLITLSEGVADVNLKFDVNVAQFKINKPFFSGSVMLNQATINYFPLNVSFKKTDVQLNFTEDALTINKLKYTNGDNLVTMNGKIDNFLELYYNNPDKMIIDWNIYSPNFNFKGFLDLLTAKKPKTATNNAPIKTKVPQKMVSGKLQAMIDDCIVNIDILADKMYYKNLKGTNFTTSIQLKNGQLFINKGYINTCNGNISFNAQIIPVNNLYNFSGNAKINAVDIPPFLTAFNNFGISSFKPNSIKGNLSATTSISGSITDTGDLIENSIKGNLDYKIEKGALDNFEPIMKIGKIAFPNRDVTDIDFQDLEGDFTVNGEIVAVNLFKVSSSILNFDVFGVYSFDKGTDIHMTIPLRDPKNDYINTDSIQRANLRYKGVILNLQAIDGPDGKIKIELNPQDVEVSNPFKKNKSKKSKKNEN